MNEIQKKNFNNQGGEAMLTLSTKVRYATRILTFLASHASEKAVSTKIISDAEEISFDYAEQILIRLKVAKLVRSIRGSHGGFLLAELPENITIANLISAIEGDINIISCLSEHCSRSPNCQAKLLWERANKALLDVFSSTTIADLAKNGKNSKNNKNINFEI